MPRPVKVSCAALALIVIAGLVLFAVYSRAKSPAMKGYKNTTYVIDGKPVTLVNGVSEVETAPGSASKVVTRYFGNDAKGDLNGDGIVDLAFLLTQEGGGSGTLTLTFDCLS